MSTGSTELKEEEEKLDKLIIMKGRFSTRGTRWALCFWLFLSVYALYL